MYANRKFSIITILVLSLGLIGIGALAQGNGNRGKRQGQMGTTMHDGSGKGGFGRGMGMGKNVKRQMMRHFYPVEMVKRHADEIKLSETQNQKMRKVVTDVRAEIGQLKWDLDDATRQLVKLVEQNATKEKIYAQMDVIFKYENKIKKKHMGLMIVIRDILTVEQKQKLDEIRAERKKSKKLGHKGKRNKRGKKNRGHARS